MGKGKFDNSKDEKISYSADEGESDDSEAWTDVNIEEEKENLVDINDHPLVKKEEKEERETDIIKITEMASKTEETTVETSSTTEVVTTTTTEIEEPVTTKEVVTTTTTEIEEPVKTKEVVTTTTTTEMEEIEEPVKTKVEKSSSKEVVTTTTTEIEELEEAAASEYTEIKIITEEVAIPAETKTTTTTTTIVEEAAPPENVQYGQCEHMQSFLKEIRECNASLERSIHHLKSLPNDETLKTFIIDKQRELHDFNAENCMNIQMLVREMMKSNETLVQRFNESIKYMMGEMHARKESQCHVVGYMTTEEFVPAEMRVQHAQNTQSLMREMKESNDSLIEQCEKCIPQPCNMSRTVSFESTVPAPPSTPPLPVVEVRTITEEVKEEEVTEHSAEQVITHEERMKLRVRRSVSYEDDFVFHTFKDPTPSAKTISIIRI